MPGRLSRCREGGRAPEGTARKGMIRAKLAKAKAAPDGEVTLTFWGAEDVRAGQGRRRGRRNNIHVLPRPAWLSG